MENLKIMQKSAVLLKYSTNFDSVNFSRKMYTLSIYYWCFFKFITWMVFIFNSIYAFEVWVKLAINSIISYYYIYCLDWLHFYFLILPNLNFQCIPFWCWNSCSIFKLNFDLLCKCVVIISFYHCFMVHLALRTATKNKKRSRIEC